MMGASATGLRDVAARLLERLHLSGGLNINNNYHY